MENTQTKLTAGSFFKKRFKIFKERWVKNFDIPYIFLKLGLVPCLIIYFFFEGTKYGDGIFQAYSIPLEFIYLIFNLVFNQSSVLELDGAKDILPCIFTLLSAGLIVHTLVEALKLFFVLFADGIELLWKKEDKIEESIYRNIR